MNPLVDDRDLDFLLYEVHDAASLLAYPHFADHAKETFDAYVGVCRRFARETLFPAYRTLDAEPPRFESGRVTAHPLLHDDLAEARRDRRRRGLAPVRRRRGAAAAHRRDRGPPLRHGGLLRRLQLRGPHDGRRAPRRGVRERGAEGDVPRAALRGALDRDDGAHGAAGGLEPLGRRDARDARGRSLPHLGLEDLHLGRGPRPLRRTSSTWRSPGSTARPPGSGA